MFPVQVVESSKMAMKLIKDCLETARITFILRRIPKAKLLVIKRNYERESLGIRRNGGTAEVWSLTLCQSDMPTAILILSLRQGK